MQDSNSSNYGATISGARGRSFRTRSLSFADDQEDHGSTEHLLLTGVDGTVTIDEKISVRDKLSDPVFSNYVTNVKSGFFTLGLVLGASLQMFFISIILMVASYSNNAGPLVELSHEYYPVFRCMFLITMFFSLYGANLFIWRRAAIDYKAVLGVSAQHTYQYVIRGSAAMAYVVFTCFLLYILTITGMLPMMNAWKHLWPALAVFLPMLLFVCPFNTLVRPCFGKHMQKYHKQRLGLLKHIFAVIRTPFTETTFLRSFIADIFCSMPKLFNDLEYTVCLYATGSFWDRPNEWVNDGHIHGYYTCGGGSVVNLWLTRFLSVLPFLIRFLQVSDADIIEQLFAVFIYFCASLCAYSYMHVLFQVMRAYRDTGKTKNLFNGVKYLLAISMASLAIARSGSAQGDGAGLVSRLDYAWAIVSVATTLYAFFWDTVMDWGLCQFLWCGGSGSGDRSSPYPMLLRDTLYFSPSTYYTAMAGNFVMRLGWAFLISPEQAYVRQNYILMLGSIELVRRFVWAIFRIEWEDIEKQKAVITELNSNL
jgi:hypothetical protein